MAGLYADITNKPRSQTATETAKSRVSYDRHRARPQLPESAGRKKDHSVGPWGLPGAAQALRIAAGSDLARVESICHCQRDNNAKIITPAPLLECNGGTQSGVKRD